jgi:hypothetical protein
LCQHQQQRHANIQLWTLGLDLAAKELGESLHLNVVYGALVEPRRIRGDDDVELLLLNDLGEMVRWRRCRETE